MYTCIDSFLVFCGDYFQRKFSLDEGSAWFSLITIIGAILTPFAGILLDRIGRRTMALITTGLLFNIAHFFIMILPEKHSQAYTFAILPLAVGYAFLVCALFSSFIYVVPKKAMGTAYGICYMFYALSLLIGSMLGGYVVPKENESLTGFKKFSVILIGYSIAGSLAAIVLHFYDAHHTKLLMSKNPNKRQRILNLKDS